MITLELLKKYHEEGFLFLENVFTPQEIHSIVEEISTLLKDNGPRKVTESNGAVRSYYGAHQVNDVYNKYSRINKLVEPAKQILESDIYIYQTKLNFKKAMRGNWWEWHQDYPYWKIEDGMTSPRAVSIMIYLDDVTEFNGPLLVVPGSHKHGSVQFDDKQDVKTKEEESWTSANLKYTISQSILKDAFENNKILSTTGKAGSVLFFHVNIFHASNCNLSPFDRKTYIVTYNSVENKLNGGKNIRPEFLSERNHEPI
jgi:ectoine hydroxylase